MDRSKLVDKYKEDLRDVDRTLSKADHYTSQYFHEMEEARRNYESWLQTQQDYKKQREVLVATLVELGIPIGVDDED